MSGTRGMILGIIGAVAIVSLGAVPAFAEEVAANPDKAVASEVVVAAGEPTVAAKDNREAGPVTAALAAPIPAPSKPKAAVQASPPVRPAEVSQKWSCFGFWCGRQIVLMLGVGY
jgi:hypothetical protein